MATMIAETAPMNRQNTVRAKAGPALAICSLATMEIVYHAYTSVIETTIAWITVTKIRGISAVSIFNLGRIITSISPEKSYPLHFLCTYDINKNLTANPS